MLVYRICKSKYQSDLSGNGAREHGGRWNSVGLPVVYTSISPSLAMLEILCSMPMFLIPNNFAISTIEIPDSIKIDKIQESALPENWKSFQHYESCRRIGDDWLRKNKSLVICVPSAVMPMEQNFLINPMHEKSGMIKIKTFKPVDFDERIISNILKKHL